MLWRDPLVERLGHDVRSTYVEVYWLPILGPSAVLAARRLVDWVESSPEEGVDVPLGALGLALGIRAPVAAHTPVVRTLSRLARFGLAGTGGTRYAIRSSFPALPARHVNRLPPFLAERHALDLQEAG